MFESHFLLVLRGYVRGKPTGNGRKTTCWSPRNQLFVIIFIIIIIYIYYIYYLLAYMFTMGTTYMYNAYVYINIFVVYCVFISFELARVSYGFHAYDKVRSDPKYKSSTNMRNFYM